MSKIIKKSNDAVIRKTAARCRERGIIIPSFAELRDPARIPAGIKKRLPGVGMDEISPLNLYRISWKNDGTTGPVSYTHLTLPTNREV